MKFDRRSLMKSAVASLACLIPSVASALPQEVVDWTQTHPYTASYLHFRRLSINQLWEILGGSCEFPDDCLYGFGGGTFWIQARGDLADLRRKTEHLSPDGYMHTMSPDRIDIFKAMNDQFLKSPFIVRKVKWITTRIQPQYRPDGCAISTRA